MGGIRAARGACTRISRPVPRPGLRPGLAAGPGEGPGKEAEAAAAANVGKRALAWGRRPFARARARVCVFACA